MDLQASGRRPILCIYHGNCADGFGAAWAVRHALGVTNVEFHAGVYGKPAPDVAGRDVVMVDFSYKRAVLDEMITSARSILVLDHHKSAREDLEDLPRAPICWDAWYFGENERALKAPMAALFDMERSGAGLAWDFFHPGIKRPPLIDHIEDRDLWRFRMTGTREVQAAVFSFPYDFDLWDELMEDDPVDLFIDGRAIERKHHKDVAELVNVAQRKMVIGGIFMPVANLPYTMASDAGNLMASRHPSKISATYYDTANARVFSLRSTDDGPDVSSIAAAYGGGGHAHAAGFRMPIGWEGDPCTGAAPGARTQQEIAG